MFEHFTRETRDTVRRATALADAEDAAVVHAEHLLLALVSPARDDVGRALVKAGITSETIDAARDREFRSALAAVGVVTERKVPPPSSRLRRGRTTRFSPSAKLALERTLLEATGEGARRISNRHLVAAIAVADVGRTPALLAELGITGPELRHIAGSVVGGVVGGARAG